MTATQYWSLPALKPEYVMEVTRNYDHYSVVFRRDWPNESGIFEPDTESWTGLTLYALGEILRDFVALDNIPKQFLVYS